MNKKFNSLDTIDINGIYWRAVPERYAVSVLESGPNFRSYSRYAIYESFSAIYFANSKEVSQYEISKNVGEDGEEFKYFKFTIKLDGIVDLRQRKTLEKFDATLADITKPKNEPGAYSVTHRIAKSVFQDGCNGLIAPSAHFPDNKNLANLVIYPGNIIRTFIKD